MDQNPYNQQGYNPQQGYMPPQQPANMSYYNEKTAPMTVGQFMIMFLILCIPIVNFIMPFVWAFGDHNINKKNLSKAMLIWMAIALVIGIIVSILSASLASMF